MNKTNTKKLEQELSELKSKVIELNKQNKSLQHEVDTKSQQLSHAAEIINKLEHLYVFKESAAEITEEINNPVNFVISSLNVIKTIVAEFKELITLYRQFDHKEEQEVYKYIERLEKEMDIDVSQQELTDALRIMKNGFEKVQEVVHNLAIFGEGRIQPKVETDINLHISHVLMLMEGKTKNKIQVVTDLQPVPLLKAEKGIFNHVFINLIKNAIESIFEKPVLKNEYLYIKTKVVDNEIVISMQDSGVGMTEETKNMLFENFYSTKRPGKGTGLGMQITKKIIESYHGRLVIDSQYKLGTEVMIYLPVFNR